MQSFILRCIYHHQIVDIIDLLFIGCAVCCDRDVQVGDVVTVGECRPLSKTVRFNVLKVSKGTGKSSKKSFQKF